MLSEMGSIVHWKKIAARSVKCRWSMSFDRVVVKNSMLCHCRVPLCRLRRYKPHHMHHIEEIMWRLPHILKLIVTCAKCLEVYVSALNASPENRKTDRRKRRIYGSGVNTEDRAILDLSNQWPTIVLDGYVPENLHARALVFCRL
jgi:hypothetical protein